MQGHTTRTERRRLEQRREESRSRRLGALKWGLQTTVSALISAGIAFMVYRWNSSTVLLQFEAQQERARVEQERLRFESALANIASQEPERRLVGYRSAAPFVASAEYRDRIRPALTAALGRHIVEYISSDSRLSIEELQLAVASIAEALRQAGDCRHLHEIAVALYGRMKTTHSLPNDLERLPLSDQNRRQELLWILRDEIGGFLFCKYMPSCASNVDFRNTIDGMTAVWVAEDGRPGEQNQVEPDAMFSFSGYPTNPKPPQTRWDFLRPLFATCEVSDRGAICRRACEPRPTVASVIERGETPHRWDQGATPTSCQVLRSMRVTSGKSWQLDGNGCE